MTSEFHRQEALQSLDVAKKALKEKNLEKAKRFALKAQKLCNCSEVKEFLKEVESTPVTPRPSSSSGGQPNLRKRAPKGTNGVQGTEEQRLLIAKINRAKDYYEILDISRECSEDDIKKSYRKLALKLHPDKNKAPGAEEAFKAVSRAFSCLSDEEKRRNYDTYGTEERVQTTRPTYYHHQAFQDDFDPQEIFNMFFGGQFPMHNAGIHRTYYHRPFPRRPPSTDGQSGNPENAGFKTLIRLLPLVVLLAFSFFSSAPAPVYSLYRDYTYRDKVVTVMHQIPFFVKSQTQFEKSYPDGTLGRRQVEDQVEATYRAILEAQCREEKVKKRRLQAWHGKEKADTFPLNSCVELKERFHSSDRKRTATRTTLLWLKATVKECSFRPNKLSTNV